MGFVTEIQAIAKALKEAGRAELQVQLLELADKARQMQEKVASLEDENRGLKRDRERQEKIFVRDEMYFVQQGDKEDGPFCTQCYDADGKLIRLQQADYSQPKCPVCRLFQGPKKPNQGPSVVRPRVVPLSQAVRQFYDGM